MPQRVCDVDGEMPSLQNNSEEPTEMTAMTDSSMTSSPETAVVMTSSTQNRKAFFKKYFKSPVGKFVLALLVVLSLAVFAYLFAKVIMGALYISSCPMDPFVPIYLIVSSSVLIVFIVTFLVVFLKCRRVNNDDDSVSSHHLIALVYFFLHLVLQLAGSVCVIRTRSDVMERSEVKVDVMTSLTPVSALTCDLSLVQFAFGVVMFELVLSGLVLLAVFLVLAEAIYLVCCSQSPEKPTQGQNNTVNVNNNR